MKIIAPAAIAACAALIALSPARLGAAAPQGEQATPDALAAAPVMGTGTYRPLRQFSHDEAARAAADGNAIARDYGLPLGLDDHGSSIATATPLRAADGLGASAEGVLEEASDRDVFMISAGPGQIAARVVTASAVPGPDLVLVLRDAAGHVVAAASPGGRPAPVLAYRLADAGTYYLEVMAPAGAVGGHFRLRASYTQAAAASPLALRLDPAL